MFSDKIGEASGDNAWFEFWLGFGEGCNKPGEDAARGEGPDQGGNLNVPPAVVLPAWRIGVEGLLGGRCLANGLLIERKRPVGVVGLNSSGVLFVWGREGDGGEADGRGDNRGVQPGQEGDLNKIPIQLNIELQQQIKPN